MLKQNPIVIRLTNFDSFFSIGKTKAAQITQKKVIKIRVLHQVESFSLMGCVSPLCIMSPPGW